MNRLLLFPALGCVVAFAVLLATLQGATRRETAQEGALVRNVSDGDHPGTANFPVAKPLGVTDGPSLTVAEAEEVLAALTDKYMRPWREWENSPSFLYSRVGPRPRPTVSTSVELVSQGEGSVGDDVFLATITVTTGPRSQAIACVLDRSTKRANLFADGQWLTQEDWLKQASLR